MRLVDFDGAAVDGGGDDGNVAERHAAGFAEAQHAAGFWVVAAVVNTGGAAPPVTGVTADVDAGVLFGEGHALDDAGAVTHVAMVGGVTDASVSAAAVRAGKMPAAGMAAV